MTAHDQQPTEPLLSQPEMAPAAQKSSEQWVKEGNDHYKAKEYEQALAGYTQAITRDPTSVLAHYNRGNAYQMLGQYHLALADFTQAISLDPKHVTAYHNRGDIYYTLQDYHLALADYERALALDPSQANVKSRSEELRRRLG
jgi:tetratricopeptide (TPR) repeat protein